MYVAPFYSGLPSSYNPVRSQILGVWDFPSLGEGFSRLRLTSLFDSGFVAHVPNQSALVTSVPAGPSSCGFGGGIQEAGVVAEGILTAVVVILAVAVVALVRTLAVVVVVG